MASAIGSAHLFDEDFIRDLAGEESVFPQKKEPWYQANDEDIPK